MVGKFGLINLGYVNMVLRVMLGAALAAVALVVISPPAAADMNCQPAGSKVECTFEKPGTSNWTVPDGVTQVTFEVFGASGGSSPGSQPSPGGLGGKASATFSVTPGETLQVNVGGAGKVNDAGGAGGFNGGGAGGAFRGGGGGGASDVREGTNFALADRIIVAGGGGGGGGGGGSSAGGSGGSGGGSSGENGSTALGAGGGGGASSSAVGSRGGGDGPGSDGNFGLGGAGFTFPPVDSAFGGGGGGGGGYYGGGGGGASVNDMVGGGGGGGSGFVDPQGTNAQLQSGVRSGDGLVKVTYDATPATFTVTNTNDDGPGSLRQAMANANANANPTKVDTINFAIPLGDPHRNATTGVCTISPINALPPLVEPVIINGYSQSSARPNMLTTARMRS